MNVQMEDGTIIEGVPEGTTKADLLAKYKPAPAAAAPNPKTDLMPVDSAPMYRDAAQLLKNVGGGIASGAGKLMGQYGMALPNAVRDLANRQMPGTTSKQLGAEAEQVGPALGAEPESMTYRGAKAVPELVATTAAMAPGVNAVASALPRAMGRLRPVVADVAANTGYAGAEAGAEGKPVLPAMGMAAAGAGAGHFVGGLAQRGVTPMLGQSARTLSEAGVTPTYGQMLGETASKIENLAGYTPLGTAIDRARTVAVNQYSRAEVNKALQPLGMKTTKMGEDAVLEADRHISNAYNAVVPDTFMPAIKAQNAISKTQQDMGVMPLLTEPQIKQVNKYIDDKIQPELAFSQRTGNTMPGRTAKNIDTELGAYARKYLESPNPADHELGSAFRALQMNLRDGLESNNKDALDNLTKANTAFRNMLPVERASLRAGGRQTGKFTPAQMFDAGQATGHDLRGGGLNRAARDLLGNGGNPFRTAAQVGGLGAGAFVDPLVTIGGLAAGHTLYSEPVRRLIARGANGRGSRLPFTAAQLAAQVGREAVNPD